jgi:hypothetical protein
MLNKAGGKNTTLFVELKTNNFDRLLELGFIKKNLLSNKNSFYLIKEYEDKKIIFLLQSGLKIYMKKNYNIELFRYPDEAYIIEYNNGKKILKILEKKEQHVEGSVETKLWSGPSLKREYEILLENKFEVFYGFCVNNFLQNKILSKHNKFIILNKILLENNISILFGDDNDYFEKIDYWINNS